MRPIPISSPHLAASRAYLYPQDAPDVERKTASSTPAKPPAAPETHSTPTPPAGLEQLTGPRSQAQNDGLKRLLRSADDVLAHQDKLLAEARAVLSLQQANSAYGKLSDA